MSLFCRWRQRALEQAALRGDALPADAALQKHISGCASCRRYWNDLRALSAELSALSEPLPAAEGFAEVTWARIMAGKASALPSFRFAPVAAVAVSLIAGVFLWNQVRLSSPRPQPVGVPSQVAAASRSSAAPFVRARRDERRQHASVSGGQPAERPLARDFRPSGTRDILAPEKRGLSSSSPRPKVAPGGPSKRRSVSRLASGAQPHGRRYRRQRHHVALAPKSQPKSSVPQRIVSVPTRPKWEQWSQWGAFYFSQGDYQRAATAYGSAYAERPDPELALAAGQAAERAGDVTQALAYYTEILNRPSGKKSPEKGTSLWTHEHDTV